MASARRFVLGRSASAMLIAFGIGVSALIAPPLALLLLALMGARVAATDSAPRFDLKTTMGPIFAALIAGALVGLPVAIGVI
ncbi:MAG: hypothetical protein ABUL42_03110, partial [Terricaulis silvestris]